MPLSTTDTECSPSPDGSSHTAIRRSKASSPSSSSSSLTGLPGTYPSETVSPPPWTEAICPDSAMSKSRLFCPTTNRPLSPILDEPPQSDGQMDDYDNDHPSSSRHSLDRTISWDTSDGDISDVSDITLLPTTDEHGVYTLDSKRRSVTSSPSPSLSPSPLTATSRNRALPPLPPVTIAKEPLPIRRQGSGAELSPIFECKMAECNGAKKARLAKEAKERDMGLATDGKCEAEEAGGEGEGEDEGEGEGEAPTTTTGETLRSEKTPTTTESASRSSKRSRKGKVEVRREISDPFVVAVIMLVAIICPPLGVWITLREAGERKGRNGMLLLATVLWVAGVIPGIILAVNFLFWHLPAGPREVDQKG